MSITDDITPTVLYELYVRRTVRHGAWVRVDASFGGLDLSMLTGPRIMPEYCLFPAILATWLNDNRIEWGDWQLRAVHETTGEAIAITTIQEKI